MTLSTCCQLKDPISWQLTQYSHETKMEAECAEILALSTHASSIFFPGLDTESKVIQPKNKMWNDWVNYLRKPVGHVNLRSFLKTSPVIHIATWVIAIVVFSLGEVLV